jgi:hypothetical protein
MRTFILLASVLATACSSVPCGSGTIERNGSCVPADVTTGTAACGPDTMLVGNMCVSTVACDPDTTMPKVDPSTGMTVCVGTGGAGGCTCPAQASSANQQNICGQIFDFETNVAYTATGATGKKCDPAAPAADGPCAVGITAYDAIAFAMNPATATPLAVADTCIDDMGHYVLKDISEPSGPFIGLGLDDIASANRGPGGVTNTVGVAAKKFPGLSLTNFEHWIAKPSTTAAWAASGGPAISTGYYAPVYRAHCENGPNGTDTQCTGDPAANQAGVMFTKSGTTEPSNTFYFQAAQTTRHDVDIAATSTGANGTALVNNASIADSLVYSGQGGLTDTVNCQWDTKAGQTLAGVVFIQVYRPVNVFGKKCAE